MARFRIVLIGGLAILLLASIFLGYYLYARYHTSVYTVTNLLNTSTAAQGSDGDTAAKVNLPVEVEVADPVRRVQRMLCGCFSLAGGLQG